MVYLKVQGAQNVPKGQRCPKGNYISKVSKSNLNVPGIQISTYSLKVS